MPNVDTPDIVSLPRHSPYFTNNETAEYLRIAPGSLRNMRSAGLGPRWSRLGRRVLYRVDDVEAWAERQMNANECGVLSDDEARRASSLAARR